MQNYGERTKKEVLLIAFVMVFGAFAPLLDATMVNIALNPMMSDFKVTLSTIQWVTTGYTLMMGIAVPFAGWATDRFEGRHVWIVGLGAFLVGSVVSVLSHDFTILLVGRLIQGASAGLLMTSLTAIIVRAAGGNLGKLMAVVGLPVLLGPILGPILGAVLVQHYDWHMIFWVNVPITIIGAVLAAVFLPKLDSIAPKKQFDWLGILLLAVMFAGFIYGISKVDVQSGFATSIVLVPLTIAVVALVLYVIYAQKGAHPIVKLDLFRSKNFSASMILLVLAGVATNGPMMLLPLFFQNVQQDTLIGAALGMVPQALGMLVTRSQAGKLTDKIGPRLIVLIGLFVTLVGTIPLVTINNHTSTLLIVLVLFVRGMGLGLYQVPVMASPYLGFSRERAGEISVATRLLQNIGGAFGSAILGIVVANAISAHTIDNVIDNLSHAYNMGFWVAVGLNIFAFIPAIFLAGKPRHNEMN